MDKYKVKINPKAIRELDSMYEYITNEKLVSENEKWQVDRMKKAILNLEWSLDLPLLCCNLFVECILYRWQYQYCYDTYCNLHI